LAFSPDGKRLASHGGGGTVKIWEATTGQEILSLSGSRVAFSPDGHYVATYRDGAVLLWDARPVTLEGDREREALGLLSFLFAKPLRQADVLDYLQSPATIIRPSARQLALSLVDRYHEETDPEKYHQASWAIVRQPYLNTFQYGFALKQAEAACRLAPEQVKYQAVLGMAQYRLGHKEQAQATLARLRDAMQKPEWAGNAEAQGFLREAEALIEGKEPEPPK
jgi:hypothetical protein